MTYQEIEQRRVIENDGNIGLFVDERERFYTEIDGKKVFFRLDFRFAGLYSQEDLSYVDVPTQRSDWGERRAWWGDYAWTWYAAERVGDTIKVIDRTWGYPVSMGYYLYRDNYVGEWPNTFLYEVMNFDLDGYLIDKDNPQSDPFGILSTGVWRHGAQTHVDYLKTLAYRVTSPLEKWAMSNESILDEFASQHIINYPDVLDDKGHIRRNTSIPLLEDWAYKKYVELYPGEKVPSTYGIEGNYPSSENAYFGKKTLTGNFRDYKFYNRGSGKYEIKTDSGFDAITGMTLVFTDQNIDAVDDIKGVFDQITGLNTDSGKMFRLYNAAFARFPDASGLKYWIGNFSSGKDDERAVASSFLASSEFKERYGENVSNAKYVETLYVNVLGRDYDQSGYNYWLGNLNNGLETRHELLLGFAESAENKVLFSEMTGFV